MYYDKARPLLVKQTHEKIKALGWEILPHPPCSPKSNLHLFQSLVHFISGTRFPCNLETAFNSFIASKD